MKDSGFWPTQKMWHHIFCTNYLNHLNRPRRGVVSIFHLPLLLRPIYLLPNRCSRVFFHFSHFFVPWPKSISDLPKYACDGVVWFFFCCAMILVLRGVGWGMVEGFSDGHGVFLIMVWCICQSYDCCVNGWGDELVAIVVNFCDYCDQIGRNDEPFLTSPHWILWYQNVTNLSYGVQP